MKICVLGGTGFIGSHIVKRLLQSAHEVIVLARTAKKLQDTGAQIRIGDLNDKQSLRRAINGVDLVIAAQMGRNPVKAMPLWLANALAGNIVVETMTTNVRAKNSKAKKMLGWKPLYTTYREGIPNTIAELTSGVVHKHGEDFKFAN